MLFTDWYLLLTESILFLQSKDLYQCIKTAMEHAATKAKYTNLPQMELGGEFPVEDIVTGEGGLLQVCIDGIEVLFADRKVNHL